jgi:5-formyltetrahydrofolate cyclo-ligase
MAETTLHDGFSDVSDAVVLKAAIRKSALARRNAMPADARVLKDRLIKERLFGLDEFRAAKSVMFFASFRTEPDTMSMMDAAIALGKTVAAPKVEPIERRLVIYEIGSTSDLVAGYMGIPEPRDDFLELTHGAAPPGSYDADIVNRLDLIIMPGAAFDPKGGRVGYGGGYYDRFLAALLKKRPPLAAIAYEQQMFSAVPVLDYDVRVDIIVTDQRVIRI